MRAGGRPARLRRRVSRPARPVRRGRERPGTARVARRRLRGAERARRRGGDGQADLQAAARLLGPAAGRVLRGRRARLARARGGDAAAAVGEALAARLERRDLARARAPRPSSTQAIELALAHDPRVIIEADAGGREVECSVIGNTASASTRRRDLATGRDRHQGLRLVRLRGQVRRRGHGAGRSGADRRPGAIDRVRELAARVFEAIAGTGLARCDFFVRDDGEVLVNEINTIPGFTETSVFGKLFEASGIPYPELCDRLVELALERHRARALVPVLSRRD